MFVIPEPTITDLQRQHTTVWSAHHRLQLGVLGPLKFVSYTEDSAELITSHQLGYHLYADDTRVIGRTKISDVPSTVNQLQLCIVDLRDCCVSRRLQLNPSKTELIWFGSRACQPHEVDNLRSQSTSRL